MTIEATTKTLADGDHPAVLISIETVDAENQDDGSITLYECHVVPSQFHALSDEMLANWMRERCQDIVLHEMDEFFRFDGEPLVKAEHPVTDRVFADVRKRRVLNRLSER